jgi:DMSO reductase anchor subunit
MINNNSQSNPKENFKINYIIYFALLAGVIMFALFAYFFPNKQEVGPNESFLNIFTYIVPTFAVFEIFLSRFMYNKFVMQIQSNATLFEKIGKYRTAKIISWALLEGAALFSVVAFIITRSVFFYVVLLVIIVAFILSKPSVDEFLNDFRIEGNERDELTR